MSSHRAELREIGVHVQRISESFPRHYERWWHVRARLSSLAELRFAVALYPVVFPEKEPT